MLSQLTNAIRATLQSKWLALLLVPAIILGMLPHTSCACAVKAPNGRCHCVKTVPAKCCCAAKRIAKNQSGGSGSTGSQFKTLRCGCTPVVIAAPAVTLAKEVRAVENATPNLMATATLTFESWPAIGLRSLFAAPLSLPSVDRVIVFLHLTI